MRKPGKTALEGSLRSLRDGIDGFTGKENIRSFIMIIKIITEGSVCKRDSFEADQGTDLKNVLPLSVH